MSTEDFNKIMEALAAISKELNDCCDRLDKAEEDRIKSQTDC